MLISAERWIAAAGALPIVLGFLLALVRWKKKQAFDFRAASIVIGSWLISFLAMWLLFAWALSGRTSFFQEMRWSLFLVVVLFPIQAYAIVFGTLVVSTWSLIGPRWVFNILTALTMLSLIYLVIVAIEGIQI